MVYRSNIVRLNFFRRYEQEMPGNILYVLNSLVDPPIVVVWTAEGHIGDCRVEGRSTVTLPNDPYDSPLPVDTTRPAFGTLNFIGPDGGDFHSVMVKAFNPEAKLIKTCPGNPPVVTEAAFEAGYLLHIPWQKNAYPEPERDGLLTIDLMGSKRYDQSNPLDVLNLLPPGESQEIARQALSQASRSSTSRRYTWRWHLRGWAALP